ncbi:NUDIX domain-containing protein [Propioniciclava sinopodophylli]|uniref:NUDIX domain-containing protein n=1 Tax=Propioniciclava sinopodophylli TaxID=1837344 RepID=A0A4Q9KHH0_9ACTN|nr:NUDIX domain-containing protein [Propioniciclava sinopodophylli]TBT88761.1 NUDIX domain-containing protein [Propioniciclava sinopodophylli]
MGVTEERIRNLVVGLVVRDGHVLLEEYPGDAWQGSFLRALGGGLEFGERVVEGLSREFREELDVEVEAVRSLGCLDNIFTWQGRPAHEVVHVFEVASPGFDAWPVERRVRVPDAPTQAGWWPIAELDGRDVYPDGITDIIRSLEDDR